MTNRLDYWSRRWKVKDTPWHVIGVNKFLYNHFEHIRRVKEEPCRVLVPLCGKTVDMKWIADQGHEVVGLEEVEQPILEFFKDQQLDYTKGYTKDGLEYFESQKKDIKIYKCNFFDISPSVCGFFDGIWDRGSLVAIAPEERIKYAQVMKLFFKGNYSYLLNSIDYDQSLFSGPPNSVPIDEIHSLYGDTCSIEILEKDNTNADPRLPTSAKMRWNVDECHEIILLLKPGLTI